MSTAKLFKKPAAFVLALLLLVSSPLCALADSEDLEAPEAQETQEVEEIQEAEEAAGFQKTSLSLKELALLEEEGELDLPKDSDSRKSKKSKSDEEEASEEDKSDFSIVKMSASSSTPMANLINGASLNPTDPQSKALDALLDDLMPTIIDDDMDTYTQVKACYDYLVSTMRYGSHRMGTVVSGGVTCNSIYSAYGPVEGYGAVALTTKTGMCNGYNAAFILMVRKIGLDANLVKGSTRRAGGGYTAHQWTEVKINGQIYIFDPQLEQDLVSAGLPRYTVFCKTYSEVPGRYIK